MQIWCRKTKHHKLYCTFRLKNNQKRFGLIKSIGWNLEVLNRLQWANKLGIKGTPYAISNYATTPAVAKKRHLKKVCI